MHMTERPTVPNKIVELFFFFFRAIRKENFLFCAIFSLGSCNLQNGWQVL